MNTRELPGYLPLISAAELTNTQLQLDAAVSDVVEKGIKRKNAYGNKGDLLQQKRMLETSIDLKESEAYMAIKGEARSQYVMIGDEKVALSNEETRKAYARTYSKDEREQLAKVEGELAKLNVQDYYARDEWETAVKAAESLQSKANLQAALLNFLAGGQ